MPFCAFFSWDSLSRVSFSALAAPLFPSMMPFRGRVCDPIPVTDRAEILDYVESWSASDLFEPPASFAGSAKSFPAGVHHSSAIYCKRNVLSSTFIPYKLLTREEFDKWAHDFLCLAKWSERQTTG